MGEIRHPAYRFAGPLSAPVSFSTFFLVIMFVVPHVLFAECPEPRRAGHDYERATLVFVANVISPPRASGPTWSGLITRIRGKVLERLKEAITHEADLGLEPGSVETQPAVVAHRSAVTPGIPAIEQFIAVDSISVSMHVEPETVPIGGSPRLFLRFTNRGASDVHLNPNGGADVFIYDGSGRPVPPAWHAIVDRVGRILKRDEFVRVAPGASWDMPVKPRHGGDGGMAGYDRHYGESDSLLLPAGAYSVRAEYWNAPDSADATYALTSAPPRVWEVKTTVTPSKLTVRPLTAAEELRLITLAAGPKPDVEAVALLGLSDTPRALSALTSAFRQNPGVRYAVIKSLSRSTQPDVAARLFREIRQLEPHDQTPLLNEAVLPIVEAGGRCEDFDVLADGDAERSLASAAAVMLARRCPSARQRLREIVRDDRRSAMGRGAAAESLGQARERGDIELLTAVLRGEIHAPPPPPRGGWDPMRRAAVQALATIGGEDARVVLQAAMKDPAAHYEHEHIRAVLREWDKTPSVETQLERLHSPDPNVVVTTIAKLESAAAKAAVPRLLELLQDRNATLRSYSASALGRIGDPAFRPAMVGALADRDENVRTAALFYLAEHGDASLLPRFIQALSVRHQYIREAAAAGIVRFGTAQTAQQIVDLMDGSDAAGRSRMDDVLQRLTFQWSLRRGTGADWGQWLLEHSGESRFQWALTALERGASDPSAPFHDAGRTDAVDFLARTDPSKARSAIERALADRSWPVRIRAARAVAALDQARGSALLVREFGGRYTSACSSANSALQNILSIRVPVDCRDPVARQSAADEWNRQFK